MNQKRSAVMSKASPRPRSARGPGCVREAEPRPLGHRVVDRRDRVAAQGAVAPDRDLYRLGGRAALLLRLLRALVAGDPLGELDRRAPLPVHRHEPVARLQHALGRIALLELANLARAGLRADRREEHEQQDEGQGEVHRRPRRDHHDPLPDGLRVVGPVADLLGKILVRVHPGDLHVAARGDRADRVLGLAHLLAPEGGREEQRELLHAHANRLRGAVVAELVEDHEQRKADEGQEEAERVHAATPLATSRACASAA